MKILEVKDLSVSFYNKNSENKVLRSVSFSLYKAKTLGIVGESGSGKSLTALSILKLLPNNAVIKNGEIIYYGRDSKKDILQLGEKELIDVRGRNISMIFQEPMTSLNPTLKCGNQVEEILMRHLGLNKRNAKRKVIELFGEVKLPDPLRICNSYPHEISGGQKQRVMIAMAIALKPSVLIADEPTTALDVTVQKAILELLQDIQQKYQMSIIFISHDLAVVSQISNEILVMYKGEVVEFGSSQQILHKPQHSYTKGLLNCRTDINFAKKRLPVLSDFINGIDENLNYDSNDENAKLIDLKEDDIVLRVNHVNKIFIIKKRVIKKSTYLKALSNISFNVYKGETLGLVGESGCGKTTLGRILVQLIEKNSGEIEYKGIPLNNLSSYELKKMRKNIQIVFQDPYSSLNPKLTIGNALMEPLIVHKLYKRKSEVKEMVFEILEKVKLDSDSFFKYPHEFSGGQRQRIAIARALVLKPEFVILDESVSALDVSVQAEVLNLLNDLKNEYRLTFIFISHDLSVVKYMADRVIVLKDGELVEINKADEIYNSPASKYTKELINSIPKIQNL